jgi:uncharacterized repeat protein (TIGR01451 family)
MSAPCRPWARRLATLVGLTLAALALGPQRLAAQPALEIRQSLPDSVEPGEPIPVEVVVRNVGKDAAEELVVSDVLPPGYRLRQATPPPQRPGDRLTWTVGRLEPGNQCVLHLHLEAAPGTPQGPLRHAVEVRYQGRAASVGVAAVKAPQLTLAVTGPESCVAGAAVPLRITVQNTGSTPARDVAIQTLLDASLSHTLGNDLETTIDVLGPGQQRTLPLEVTPARGGDARARETVQARGLAPLVREVTLRVTDVRLVLQARGPAVLQQLLTGLFETTVRNDDARVARQVGLTVQLPPGLAFVRAGGQGRYDPQTQSIHWEFGDLRPGEERTVAWNGTAQAAGAQECKSWLALSGRVCQEAAWTARVAPDTPAPVLEDSPPAGPK